MSAADARRQASLAEQASRWVVRRSGQPLAPEAQAEFDAWYQADIRHAEAYDRLARIWRRMGDIDQARLAKRPARGRKATVAALLIAATAWPVWQFSRDAHPGADYASGNALRVVELPDGSSVTLDAESAIALDYAAGKRVVRLLAGRALFEAAPAAQGGPAFTVTTPDASATALGTRYTVERQEHGTRVAVYEHRVQVHCRICADDRADILDSGDSVQVSADGIVRVASSSEAAPDWSKACSRSTMWRCRRRRRNCPATPASACWCWGRPRAMRASPAPRAWPTRNARWNCCSRRPACGSPTCRDCCCCVDRDDRHAAAHLPLPIGK